jgi:surfeit locus 1 family protein
MAAGYAFRPRGWTLAAAGLACAAGIALGNWQTGRAAEKRALGALERVVLEGEFVPRFTVYLDNKTHRGKVGYEVITPLRVKGSDKQGSAEHVLVNRGWVEAARTRDVLPEVATPAGEVRIEGVSLARLPRVLMAGKAEGKVRQTIDIGAYAAETGLRLQPRVLEQHSDTRDGLARDWPPHDAGAEKNEGYALQWYSLAALAVVLGIVFSFRKREAASQ